MTELEFSCMSDSPDIRAALAEFEAQHRIKIRVVTYPWSAAWTELVKIALHKMGPDVSEIGSTWTQSLVSVEAVRPFVPLEVSTLGGSSAFLPAAWQSGLAPDYSGKRSVWAIPWISDTRLIYYRRDWLQQAGIDEQTAFQTFEQLERTLQRLQENGVAIPWAIATNPSVFTLHTLAAWVWGAGGDFLSADGKRTQFSKPEAQAGILAYFNLYRYIAPAARNLDATQASELFHNGQAAVTVSTPGFLQLVRNRETSSVETEHIGIALMPGVPFVGGTNLIVWKHCRYTRSACDLVRFLTSRQGQIACCTPKAGLFPTRLEALDGPTFMSDSTYVTIGQSLKTGRGFHGTYVWGAVEERLATLLGELWAEIFANPDVDVAEIVKARLDVLAQRLDSALSG
jgi:multiple sugar transport system substrate-binding protein